MKIFVFLVACVIVTGCATSKKVEERIFMYEDIQVSSSILPWVHKFEERHSSQFNALGLGTTQLYNRVVVFNRKRVGEFALGGCGRMAETFHTKCFAISFVSRDSLLLRPVWVF